MKKAIISTSIVLIISFISTVCFGIALSAQVARGVIDPESQFNKWFDKFENTENAAMKNSRDINEYFWDENDTKLIGTDKIEVTPATPEASLVDVYNINAELAKIKVVQTSGDKVIFTLNQYSKAGVKQEAKPYTLLQKEEKIIVSVIDEQLSKDTLAVLTIEFPKKAFGNMNINLNCGYVTFNDAKLDNLNIKVGVGDVLLNSGESKACDLKVESGNISVKDFSAVKNNIKIANGNAQLILSSQQSFNFKYKVVGTIDCRNFEKIKGFPSNAGVASSEFSYNSGSKTTNYYDVNIIGNLELFEKVTV
ncbi:MAG: DUF4097 family beta strand repeat-containing protein [Oscillospiraceae bacterium]